MSPPKGLCFLILAPLGQREGQRAVSRLNSNRRARQLYSVSAFSFEQGLVKNPSACCSELIYRNPGSS